MNKSDFQEHEVRQLARQYEQKAFLRRTNPEERDDVVLGYGLQQAGRPGEALQTCPTGGEEGPDDDDPRRGPRQGAHHQVLVHRVAVPAGRNTPRHSYSKDHFETHVWGFWVSFSMSFIHFY